MERTSNTDNGRATAMANFLHAQRQLREKAAAEGVPGRAVAHLDMAMMVAEGELRWPGGAGPPVRHPAMADPVARVAAAVICELADSIEHADDLAAALVEVERKLDYIRGLIAILPEARRDGSR